MAAAHGSLDSIPNGRARNHPLGMSGARLALTAAEELTRNGWRNTLVTTCVAVGQGIRLLIERV
jgi:acetyl-CoA acetyltransferase